MYCSPNAIALVALSNQLDGLLNSIAVSSRIGNARVGKPFATQLAGIAIPASPPFFVGIVTAQGQRIIDAESGPFADDVGLGHFQKRRMYLEFAETLHTGLGGQIGKPGESLEELRSAIRIARVIEHVGADEDVEGADCFRVAKRDAKQNRVARRNIRDRNPVVDLIGASLLRNFDRVGQRRSADGAQVELHRAMLDNSETKRDFRRLIELDAMALPVVDAQ